MKVHHTNADDGCNGLSSFNASTGITSPLLMFREFCDDNGFCANLKSSADDGTGLHISLDGIDITLGAATNSVNCIGDPKTICNGILGIFQSCQANTRENVNAAKCK